MDSMKKALLTLAILALTASCGWLGWKKQAAVDTSDTVVTKAGAGESVDSALVANPLEQWGGVYRFGDPDLREEPWGEVYIHPVKGGTALMYLYKNNGAPTHNTGAVLGRITIYNNGEIGFRKRIAHNDSYCLLDLDFDGETLVVTEDEDDCDCGFGQGVHIKDSFRRATSDVPQFYTSVAGEKRWFDWMGKFRTPMELPFDWSLEPWNSPRDHSNFKPSTMSSQMGWGATKGLEPYYDSHGELLYYPLPSHNGSRVILVSEMWTSDEGVTRYDDTSLALLTLKNGEVVDKLSVLDSESLYRSAGPGRDVRYTTFSIDENYIITTRTVTTGPEYRGEPYSIARYEIDENGMFLNGDSFVLPGDWPGVKSRRWSENKGSRTLQEGVFPEATMKQVYDIVKRFDRHLNDELPESDLEYIADEENHIRVIYKYETSGLLRATVLYDGGVTTLTLEEMDGGVNFRISYSHDSI
jgi:hypothetical protein